MVWKIWCNKTFISRMVPAKVPTEFIEGDFDSLEEAKEYIEAHKDLYHNGVIMEIGNQVIFHTEKKEITILKFSE